MGRSSLNRNLYHLKNNRTLSKVCLALWTITVVSKFSAEIVKFREMLEDRINQQLPPLTAFPDEHRPLIAKLAHERFVFIELCGIWLLTGNYS